MGCREPTKPVILSAPIVRERAFCNLPQDRGPFRRRRPSACPPEGIPASFGSPELVCLKGPRPHLRPLCRGQVPSRRNTPLRSMRVKVFPTHPPIARRTREFPDIRERSRHDPPSEPGTSLVVAFARQRDVQKLQGSLGQDPVFGDLGRPQGLASTFHRQRTLSLTRWPTRSDESIPAPS